MRELPCLMNGFGVRATLAGTKTQTRRPVKLQPPSDAELPVYFDKRGWTWLCEDGVWPSLPARVRNPLGVPGDLLYVRETWCGHWGPILDGMREPSRSLTNHEIPQRDGGMSQATPDDPLHLYYRATWGDEPPLSHIKWRPSIHMFKWAARLWTLNTGVRVEHGPEISEAGARAEGFESTAAFMAWWAKQYPGVDWRFVTSYEVAER